MKLKLDESLPRRLTEPLRSLGHDVSTATDENLLGEPDEVIAAAALHEQRILLSFDLGFADIRTYPPGAHPGIVVFRLAIPSFQIIEKLVTDFVRRSDLEALKGCTVMVEPGRVRVRWPEPGDEQNKGGDH